jgi:hypothetical protein
MVIKKMFISSFKIKKDFNDSIKKEILSIKDSWKKDLNNVKALTSGWQPDYSFFKTLNEQMCLKLNEITKIKLKPDSWWANYYNKGHFTKLHHHQPALISSVVFIKIDNTNPLYFNLKPGILNVKEEEGLVIVFDSKLEHGVNSCNEERITLAVDFIKDI